MLCILPYLLGKFIAIGKLDFKVRNPWASAEIKKAFLFGLYSQIYFKNWLQKSDA